MLVPSQRKLKDGCAKPKFGITIFRFNIFRFNFYSQVTTMSLIFNFFKREFRNLSGMFEIILIVPFVPDKSTLRF